MSIRIRLAHFLVRLGEFIRTLPVVVLRPADMIEWSRQTYDRNSRDYGIENDADVGLTPDETTLWEKVQAHQGRVLVLGGGGGREVVFFARQGWQVTAVDFSESMLELARTSALERGLFFEGWVGDIAHVDVPPATFDLVWISMFLYSVVLNRNRRIKMLRLIHAALKPNGHLVCSFHWDPQASGMRGRLLRKLVAWLTLGNICYEDGDILFGTIEFRHAFASEAELRTEFSAGGFEVMHMAIFSEMIRGGAILRNKTIDGMKK